MKDLTTGKDYEFAIAAENKVGLGESTATDKPVAPRKKLGNLFLCPIMNVDVTYSVTLVRMYVQTSVRHTLVKFLV